MGLDIGPQSIAIVSKQKKYAKLCVFADELNPQKKKRKKIQRKIARRLRQGNPEKPTKKTVGSKKTNIGRKSKASPSKEKELPSAPSHYRKPSINFPTSQEDKPLTEKPSTGSLLMRYSKKETISKQKNSATKPSNDCLEAL